MTFVQAPATPLTWDEALRAPVVTTTRRCDIYEGDAVTPYLLGVGLEGGAVSVDATRDERRTVDCELYSVDPRLRHYPGGFWYDKILKLYRGTTVGDVSFETQIGEFEIDSIGEDNFPGTIAVSGRDRSKTLLRSKFAVSTTFASGQAPEEIIRTIATNGGITKFRISATGKTTGKDFTFDRGATRWQSIVEVAEAYGLEVFFDAFGYLVSRDQRDPTTSPLSYTFYTGAGGQVGTYNKKTFDTRLYNHIAVTGEAAGQTTVFAEAINTEPSSPTRVLGGGAYSGGISDRLYELVSSFITTTAQAQDVADKHLKLHALEQFELTIQSLVVPWLEGNDIFGWVDPDPNPGDPTRFLMSSFTIPLALELMSINGKRVTSVG